MSRLSSLFVNTLIATILMASSVTATGDVKTSTITNKKEFVSQSVATEGELVREQILEKIGDDPTMVAIAGCESTGNPRKIVHTEPDGSLLKNSTGKSSAAGAFQVLLKLHGPDIKKMGLNMKDLGDYMEFVAHLKDTQGYDAWKASKSCWKQFA